MKHLLAATALTLSLSPAFAEIQVRSAALAYDTSQNVTWARDTLLFDAVAARMGGSQALKEEIYRVSPTVFELPNATWPSDGRDPSTGQWYQFLNINVVNGNRIFTDFSLDATGNTTMNWYGANAFVNYLNASAYEGVNNWRLPRMNPSGNLCIGGTNAAGPICPYSRDNNEVQSLMYSLGMQDALPWTSPSSSPLNFRGLRNGREYALSDQYRRFTNSVAGGLVFVEPPDWYMAAVTGSQPLFDAATGESTVMANAILRPKTVHGHFIMLRDGDVLAATPPVPEPSTWALMLAGLGLMAWRAAARGGGRAGRAAA